MDDINLQSKNQSGIRTGKEYLQGLRDNRNIWMHCKKVDYVTKQDGLRRCAETLATFLDNQHHPKYINDLTYIDDDGDRCAIAFQIPKSKEYQNETNLITSGLNGQTVILEELLIIRMLQ